MKVSVMVIEAISINKKDRVNTMLGADRRNTIVSKLHEQGSVTVIELVDLLEVSPETVRRDLEKLENESKLVRTYGGAYVVGRTHLEIPLSTREISYIEGKKAIANLCADLINNGDTIILDSSNTALHIAEKIKERRNLVVITNALRIASELASSSGIKVIVIGGTMRPNSLSFIGPSASQMLNQYYADKAFVSCTGVDMQNGITDTNDNEAQIRSIMLNRAKMPILIADNTKFNLTTLVKISDLSEVNNIITDKYPGEAWEQYFSTENKKCLYPTENVDGKG